MLRNTRIRSIYRIPGSPDAPAVARGIAARELHGLDGSEAMENAVLLLSELMTERLCNSVQVDPRMTVDVILVRSAMLDEFGERPVPGARMTADRHRWCVIDRGYPTLPVGLRSTALDALTHAWGVSRHNGMTHSWFELRGLE